MLSAKKIELAVLHKLYQFAERNEEAPTPTVIAGAFKGPEISLRRIEVALDSLVALGQAESIPDPTAGVYRWQIASEGFGVVDRALRIPTTFIARLNLNGDAWLQSEEAEAAVLNKLAKEEPAAAPTLTSNAETPLDRAIHVNVTSTNSNNLAAPSSSDDSGNSAARASWWSAWGTWAAAAIALAALALALHQAKVF